MLVSRYGRTEISGKGLKAEMLTPRGVSLREEGETTTLLRRLLPFLLSCFEKNFGYGMVLVLVLVEGGEDRIFGL